MSSYNREYKEMGGETLAYLEIPDGYEAPPRIEFPVYEVSGRLGKRTFVRVDPSIADDEHEFEARCRAVTAAARHGDQEVWAELLADLSLSTLEAISAGEWSPNEGARKAAQLTELAKDQPAREGRTDG